MTDDNEQREHGPREHSSKSQGPVHGGGLVEAYAGAAAEELPVAAYAGLIATYCGIFGSALWASSRRGRLRRSLRPRDIVLLGIATHRISRILTRDRIAAPLRMPFTRYEGKAGAGELIEHPRGGGLRKALGGLLTCQFCAAPWVAASLAFAHAARPRETKMVASVFSIVTVADFLHQLYAATRSLSR
jgi:hypothetical protein